MHKRRVYFNTEVLTDIYILLAKAFSKPNMHDIPVVSFSYRCEFKDKRGCVCQFQSDRSPKINVILTNMMSDTISSN